VNKKRPHCRVGMLFEPGKPGGFPHGWSGLPRKGLDHYIQILGSLYLILGSKIRQTYHQQCRRFIWNRRGGIYQQFFFILLA